MNQLEKIIELGKKGLNVHEIAEKLDLGVKGVYYHLTKNKLKLKDLAKSPQDRAWETRHKQEAVEAYKNAPTTGLKASVARKFKVEFGTDIKELVAPKVENIVAPKAPKAPKVARVTKAPTTKESFKEKEHKLMLPFGFVEAIERQIEAKYEARILALEKLLKKK